MNQSGIFKIVYLLLVPLYFLVVFECQVFAATRIKYKDFSVRDRDYLISIFKDSGYDSGFLKKIFYNKKLRKIPVIIRKNIINKEFARNYSDFHSAYSLKIAYRFSKKWRSVLERASRVFQVDREVLLSILLIETGFGSILGRYPVVSVFSSIILENHLKQKKFSNNEVISKENRYIIKRLSQKSKWAKIELFALLKIIKETNHNPFHYKGSFAGAFGIPQFLPSSYLKWGYDSDNNGTVNLFLFPDAIFSIANYLKAHGWKKGLYLESNKDVIYKYNNSRIYVETVLEVAGKIKVYKPTKRKTKRRRPKMASDIRKSHKKDRSQDEGTNAAGEIGYV